MPSVRHKPFTGYQQKLSDKPPVSVGGKACKLEDGQHLYVIQSRLTGTLKIGRSKDPEARLLQLQTGSPHQLRLILVWLDHGYLEKEVHKKLTRFRTCHGITDHEWFSEDCIGSIPEMVQEQFMDWWREMPDWYRMP